MNLVNSLAIKYSRSLIVEPNSLDLTTSRKHRRQASSISSSNPRVTKKTKTLDLVNLSSSSNSNLILSSILKEFLQDPTASFRSLKQELLIKSILLKIPYILAVLPTSIRKSLAYLLISSLSISKVTIVILPLIRLKYDILKQAKEFNIPYSIFEEN